MVLPILYRSFTNRHSHEQAGCLVSGQVGFTVDSEKIICDPGDSWCIAGDKEHGAEALEDYLPV